MGGPMTMNRVIHAAVRRDLARLEGALGAVRDGDTARAGQLLRAYQNLRRELTHHHEGEDELIFPMLSGLQVDPVLLETMESEHQAMAAALTDTSTAMERYAATGSADDARAARASVVQTQQVVDQHLTHEEQDLEPTLLPHLESAEWKAVEKKLSRQPPGIAGRFFAWIEDGMDEESRTYLRGTVPAPVRFILGRFFGRQYHREIAPVWSA